MRRNHVPCIVFSAIVAAACNSSEPTGSASVARQLGVAPSNELVGIWVQADAGDPSGFKSKLELDADGNFTLLDHSAQPDRSGTWGVIDRELDLIFDPDAGTYHRTAWTYLVDDARLGVGYIGSGDRPAGSWSGHFIDEQLAADAAPQSGIDTGSLLELAADGTASVDEATSEVTDGVVTTHRHQATGNYVVAGDRSLTVTLRTTPAADAYTLGLAPLAQGYAVSALFVLDRQ
jgi:hypothetical protein